MTHTKKIRKPICYLFIVLLISAVLFPFAAPVNCFADTQDKLTVIYFYLNACQTCNEAKKDLDELDKVQKSSGAATRLDVKMYDGGSEYGYPILQQYFETYKVPKEHQVLPIAFVGDNYFYDRNRIRDGITGILKSGKISETKILDSSLRPGVSAGERLSAFKASGVFLVGLVNGLNPCSLSMLFFLFSLLMVKKADIRKMGGAFILGKFIMYLSLGTLFYNLLEKLQIGWYQTVFKILMLLFVLLIAGLNIKDYIAARDENYGKIVVQLPLLLRKYNHRWIQKAVSGAAIRRCSSGAVFCLVWGFLSENFSVRARCTLQR